MPTANNLTEPRIWNPPSPMSVPEVHRRFVGRRVTVVGWYAVDQAIRGQDHMPSKYLWFGFVSELDRKVPESELTKISQEAK